MRTAAIGIGSNSLRMLVAEIKDGQLIRIRRFREGMRVFAALDEEKNICPEMIENACKSVQHFYQEAITMGAEEVHLFATSAVRDAANQEVFSNAILEATGLQMDICSGETEAHLSFWGVCGNERTGLIDIGGGSTEIAIGCGRNVENSVSLQMGAVRLYREYPIASYEDAMLVVEKASGIIKPVKSVYQHTSGIEWVGVGGTFTTCAAVAQRISWQEREKIHHYCLTKEAVKKCMAFLSSLPFEERINLECLQPQRADIVVHGIAVLLACMQEFHIPYLMVSECGNLEGYLKEKYLF